jgi:hypothetical protein
MGDEQNRKPVSNTERFGPRSGRSSVAMRPAETALSGDPCAGYRSQPTLSQESASKSTLTPPRVSVDAMSPAELFNMKAADRLKWYCTKLCGHQAQLFESSLQNNVPTQLIATCIPNELSDIGEFPDVWQEKLGATKGSLGPAQMQVLTAIEHGHVDIPQEILTRNARANSMPPMPLGPALAFAPQPPRNTIVRSHVAKRLKIIQVAIEAAAREIARLLALMAQNKTRPWQLQHMFNAPEPKSAPRPDVYFKPGSIRGLTDKERFEQLCELVIAAYNSPDIIFAVNPGRSILAGGSSESPPYLNGRLHGFNGCTIGWEIFQAGLFARRS